VSGSKNKTDISHFVEAENRMETDDEVEKKRQAVRLEPDHDVKRAFFGNKERARQLGGKTAIVYRTKDGTDVRRRCRRVVLLVLVNYLISWKDKGSLILD
jgi:hypothetical protein